jgi:hypothetical protein
MPTLHRYTFAILKSTRDASYPMLPYLTFPSPESAYDFDPPSSLFAASRPLTILELGSGQSLASIHLIDQLSGRTSRRDKDDQSRRDLVVLTDLPEVLDLCHRNVQRFRRSGNGQGRDVGVDVISRPLPWGDTKAGTDVLVELAASGRNLTHILMIDLVRPIALLLT